MPVPRPGQMYTQEESAAQKGYVQRLEEELAGLRQEKRNWQKLLNEDMLAVIHAVDNCTQRFERFETNQGKFAKRLDDMLSAMEAWAKARGKQITDQWKGKTDGQI